MYLQISPNKKMVASIMLVCLAIMAINICRTEAAPLPPPTYYITSNYTMQEDMYARFVINANNITFNFNGHTISGNGDGTAIYINSRDNITLQGTGYIDNHYRGIYIRYSEGVSSNYGSYINIKNCDYGVYVYDSDWCTLRNFDIWKGGYGIYIQNSSHCAVINYEADNFTYPVSYGMMLSNNYQNEYNGCLIKFCKTDGIDANDEDYSNYGDISTIQCAANGLDFQNADFTDFYPNSRISYSNYNFLTGFVLYHNSYTSRDGFYEYVTTEDNHEYGHWIKSGSINNEFRYCTGRDNWLKDLRDENGQGPNDYINCSFNTIQWY